MRNLGILVEVGLALLSLQCCSKVERFLHACGNDSDLRQGRVPFLNSFLPFQRKLARFGQVFPVATEKSLSRNFF